MSEPEGSPKLGFADFRNAVVEGGFFTDVWFAHHAWFEGVTFRDTAWFDGVGFGAHATFNNASFERDALFDLAAFSKVASFSEVKFGGETRFTDTRFADDAWFSHSSFQSAHFGRAQFRGKAGFDSAVFNSYAEFHRTVFADAVFFGRAKFRSTARFTAAAFKSGLRMQGVESAGEISIEESVVGGGLQLSGARVDGALRVSVAADQVRCTGAVFGGRVWLRLRGGEVWLTDSVCSGPVTVESWLRPPLAGIESWLGSSDNSQVQFFPSSSKLVVRSLRNVDAAQLTLADVDLGQCELSGLRRPELVRLDGRCTFAPVPRGWCLRWGFVPWRWTRREALYDEHLWRVTTRAAAPRNGWASVEDDEGDEVVGPDRLAVLYRQLRRSVEAAKYEPGAADFYFGEMEMRRLASERFGERLLLTGYWLVSGYGLRACRALVALGVLVVGAALLLQYFGFRGRVPEFADCVLYAAGSVVSVGLTRGHVPQVLTDLGEVVRLGLRVAGPVLLTLAALAVRGRVKR